MFLAYARHIHNFCTGYAQVHPSPIRLGASTGASKRATRSKQRNKRNTKQKAAFLAQNARFSTDHNKQNNKHRNKQGPPEGPVKGPVPGQSEGQPEGNHERPHLLGSWDVHRHGRAIRRASKGATTRATKLRAVTAALLKRFIVGKTGRVKPVGFNQTGLTGLLWSLARVTT